MWPFQYIPVYTKLFCISATSNHLAGYTSEISLELVLGAPVSLPRIHIINPPALDITPSGPQRVNSRDSMTLGLQNNEFDDMQFLLWLVVWNIFYFPILLKILIPIDFHIFQRGRYTGTGIPPTSAALQSLNFTTFRGRDQQTSSYGTPGPAKFVVGM